MTIREELHELIDQLPEQDLEQARRDLEKHLAKNDPVLRAFLEAPEDDEPETDEERDAVAEAYDAIARGDVISDAELRRELGL